MQHLVVLNCDSLVGQNHAANNDGLVRQGSCDHPVLRCTELRHDDDNAYVRATRWTGERLFFSYSSTVAIYRMRNSVNVPEAFRPPEQRAADHPHADEPPSAFVDTVPGCWTLSDHAPELRARDS
jgi:hypothetical protein